MIEQEKLLKQIKRAGNRKAFTRLIIGLITGGLIGYGAAQIGK
jgi:hypothetical protein